MSEQSEEQQEKQDGHEHGSDHIVHITIDGNCHEIKIGDHKVSEIKRVGNVPAAYVLVEEVKGRLVPLADDSHVKIKGGEIFESHPRDGGSS